MNTPIGNTQIGLSPRFGVHLPEPTEIPGRERNPYTGALWHHIQEFRKLDNDRITVYPQRDESGRLAGRVDVDGKPFGEPIIKDSDWYDLIPKLLKLARQAAKTLEQPAPAPKTEQDKSPIGTGPEKTVFFQG